MRLPDDYLEYSERSYGLDHDRHDWVPMERRDPLRLKNDKKAAAFIVVPLEFFPLDPPGEPFLHPGSMKTPYPDLRHYTTRDYGNRVGVYRILNVLEDVGMKATFVVNAAVAERYSPLVKAVEQAGHEIAAHGVSTAHIHHEGLSCRQEEDFIARCRAEFPDAKTWMSPARNQSYRTLDLLAQAGFEVCLDWEADQRPLALRTEYGPITSLPLMNELSDFTLLIDRRQQADDWANQILEAAQFHLDAHAAAGAQCFGFTLTPYIVGQPFRVSSLKNLLSGLAQMVDLEVVTAAHISSLFLLPDEA